MCHRRPSLFQVGKGVEIDAYAFGSFVADTTDCDHQSRRKSMATSAPSVLMNGCFAPDARPTLVLRALCDLDGSDQRRQPQRKSARFVLPAAASFKRGTP